MAKFYDLHLLLQEEQRILFGDDSLGKGGPSAYPATNLGSEKPFIGYTTISGYNDTYPGMGLINIASTAELVISTPVASERATQPYHLVRYDQLQDAIFDESSSDWQDSVLTMTSGTPPLSPVDGDRYIVAAPGTGLWSGLVDSVVEWNTASGTWDVYPPNEGFTTFVEDEDKYYVYYNGAWGPFGEGIDHGDLVGLEDDDHTQYILVDGSRGFTSTVSGITPVDGSDLVTKDYVDGLIADPIDNVVTTTGTQTITGDKTFDNTLTTFLGDVFFDGITITMSGTTLNTTSGAVFNYDDSSTINNEGETNYLDGSTVDHESGSTETYESGSTINNSGDTNYDSTATITTSGTDINYGDGTTVNFEDGSTETYEGGSNTYHDSGSVDNYLPGSIVNISGSEVNFEGDTDINFGPSTTTVNEGDTTYVGGSTVTFSGTTTFNSPTYFNEDIFTDGATISGTGDIYTDNIYANNIVNVNQKWGRIACIDGNRNQAVTFGTAWPDDDYTVVATLTNEVDSTPSIYSTIQGVKAGTGFTTHFSGKIDSANFVLEWHAFKGQQN